MLTVIPKNLNYAAYCWIALQPLQQDEWHELVYIFQKFFVLLQGPYTKQPQYNFIQ